MGLRDKLERAKFTAEGAGRAARSKLQSSADGARSRASDVDAKRVARKTGRLTQQIIEQADSEQATRPRSNREVAQAAGEQAQMGGPMNATLSPLSSPEQTYQIAGGAPQRGQPLDRLAVGGGSQGDGGQRQSSSMMVGVSPVGGMDVGMSVGSGGQSDDEGSGDPLVVDEPLMGGGDYEG